MAVAEVMSYCKENNKKRLRLSRFVAVQIESDHVSLPILQFRYFAAGKSAGWSGKQRKTTSAPGPRNRELKRKTDVQKPSKSARCVLLTCGQNCLKSSPHDLFFIPIAHMAPFEVLLSLA